MDLITQGLLGGALAVSASSSKHSRKAAAIGFAAAMLADADVFISASDDPLLNVEFHRHFSHSLIFIPIGALIATLLLWPLLRKGIGFLEIYRYAFLGYATAGLLDACTSYGTHLLWPFSDTRIAWSIIAIVDPVFSLALLISLILGFRYRSRLPARIGLGIAGAYLLAGLWQHHNALQLATELAQQRGQKVDRILVKPTLANLVLWRSVYESDGIFYVDAIRVGPGPDRTYPGGSVARFNPGRDLPGLAQDTVLRRDIDRFSRLADGFVVLDSTRKRVLTDIRYSMLPTTLTPMWGLDLNQEADSEHARFEVYRDRPDNARELFTDMLLGRDPAD